MARASVVVNILSNAVIEAALAGRPVLCVDLGGQPDIFQQQRFFGAVIRSENELERRLQGVEADFAQALGQSRAFAEFRPGAGGRRAGQYPEALQALRHQQPLPSSIRQCTPDAHPADLRSGPWPEQQ